MNATWGAGVMCCQQYDCFRRLCFVVVTETGRLGIVHRSTKSTHTNSSNAPISVCFADPMEPLFSSTTAARWSRRGWTEEEERGGVERGS